MAFPTILVDSATGSDSAASGAGPTTALTGTNASFAAAVVTLDGSPDLSGVATDGSACLYLVTSSGVKFFKITAADNGADTVTVTPNPAGTSTGRTWAIGGKRASIGSSTSRVLFENGGSTGDAKAGWVVEMQSGHTESISAVLNIRIAGSTTDGPFTLRGTGATRPIITYTGSGFGIEWIDTVTANNVAEYFEIKNTGTGTYALVVRDGPFVMRRVKVWGTTNWANNGIFWAAVEGNTIELCEVTNCTGIAVALVAEVQTLNFIGNWIHDNTTHGLSLDGGPFIFRNVFADNGGDGINSLENSDGYRAAQIIENVFYSNASDGIEFTAAGTNAPNTPIINNLFIDNGGYGINCSSATVTANYLLAQGARWLNNGFNNNTSGDCNRSGVLVDSVASVAVDNGSFGTGGDFTIGSTSTAKAVGFPAINIATGTRSYVDIGVAQRQEAGGAAGMLYIGGMSGGFE